MKTIKLTQGKVALVDDLDFEYLNQWKWCAHRCTSQWYAVRSVKRQGKNTTVQMHTVILGLKAKQKCDHRDGNGLNNQRANLRRCNWFQNARNTPITRRNTSGFKGVSWQSRDRRWVARIQSTYLGYFKDPISAALAYDKAAIRKFGAFARTNQMQGRLQLP